MNRRLTVIAVVLTCSVVVSLAGAQAPNATLLVLQPADMPSYIKTGTAPQLTTSDGDLSVSASKYGRVSGAVSFYTGTSVGPTFLTSRAVIFRDATGAHGAFLEVRDKLNQKLNSTGSAVAVGQEAWRFNVLILGEYVVWRQGYVLAEVQTSGGRGPGSSATDYVPLQQNRIAALVPPSNPGPPVVIKPVVGKPVAKPRQPRAGKRFAVTFRVTRSNDGAPMTNAAVKSSTRIAGKPVRHGYSFSAGQLRVKLTLPKTAKGKPLRVTVKVIAEGQAATKVVAYKVR